MDSYVVEPQSLFVPYLADVLAQAEMRVVRVAPHLDVQDVLRIAPQALFVDTDFLEIDPADALRAMREALPSAFICAYAEIDAPAAERFRRAGANCVLSKKLGPAEIADRLRTARRAPARVETVRGEI